MREDSHIVHHSLVRHSGVMKFYGHAGVVKHFFLMLEKRPPRDFGILVLSFPNSPFSGQSDDQNGRTWFSFALVVVSLSLWCLLPFSIPEVTNKLYEVFVAGTISHFLVHLTPLGVHNYILLVVTFKNFSISHCVDLGTVKCCPSLPRVDLFKTFYYTVKFLSRW